MRPVAATPDSFLMISWLVQNVQRVQSVEILWGYKVDLATNGHFIDWVHVTKMKIVKILKLITLKL